MPDAVQATAVVRAGLDGTRYLARALELLEAALAGDDPECVGKVSLREHSVDGLLLHGPIAGALAVEKLHVLIGDDPDALGVLVRSVRDTTSARMIICELPDTPEHAAAFAVLAANGFTREGSVAQFFAEDIALDLLVWRRAEARG